MKISNSKKQLAKIISENGGWRDEAESAAQCIGGEISFWHDTATKQPGEDWCGSYLGACDDIEFTGIKLPNWHQTILSRKEYFHLHLAPDADGWIEWGGGECPVENGSLIDVKKTDGSHELAVHDPQDRIWNDKEHRKCIVAYRPHNPEQAKPEFCESVMRSIPEPEIHNKNTALTQVDDIDVVESKPTIEQLSADYHNLLDFARRKQEEADDAKADAEAKLAELVAAGKALGLVLSVADQDPELVITDWRDLQAGDVIRCIGDAWDDGFEGSDAVVTGIESPDYEYEHRIRARIGEESDWGADFQFIRRPSKGESNA